MSFIKNPSEIEEKKILVMMVYGSPGSGKTTLGLSAPRPVLIDTDGGVSRTHSAHRCPTVQVKSWEDIDGAMNEIAAGPFDTVVVDTVGKLLDYMSEFIIRTNPKMKNFYTGNLSQPGFGVRKNMFREFIKRCQMMQRNVLFVAHANETKIDEAIKVEPIVGGSSANDLLSEIDMCGYLTVLGGKRVIFWGDDGSGLAKQLVTKNTCFLPNVMEIPVVADASGEVIRKNDFLAEVFKTYADAQRKKEETNREYDKLIAEASERIAACANDKDLNKLRKELGSDKFGHIYDSKLVLGGKLMAKAKELGFVYSKVDAKFTKPEPEDGKA